MRDVFRAGFRCVQHQLYLTKAEAAVMAALGVCIALVLGTAMWQTTSASTPIVIATPAPTP